MPLGLPTSAYSRCFRTVAEALRNSPYLQRVPIKTYRLWDGSTPSEAAAPPTVAQAPWVRVSPEADPERWRTSGQHESPLLVKVETFVEGTRAEDAMDLWAAIAGGSLDGDGNPLPSALFPADRSLITALEAAGCRGGYEVSQAALGAYTATDGEGIAAVGMVRVNLWVRTDM